MARGVTFTEEAADAIAEAALYTLANRSVDPGVAGRSAASPAEAFTARCTSATADAGGNFPGVITRYDAPTAAWVDYGACKLRAPNGGGLASGSNYPVQPAGATAGGDALYLVGTLSPDAIPIGTVAPYAGGTIPAGWMLCNGGAVSRTTYADLFAAIGTNWGAGDGSTTFNVPDLGGRVPVGYTGVGGRGLGQYYGKELADLPSHNHAEGTSISVNDIPGAAWQIATYTPGGTGIAVSTGLAGSPPTPANALCIQPSAGVAYMIKFAFQAGYVNPFTGSGVVGLSGTFS